MRAATRPARDTRRQDLIKAACDLDGGLTLDAMLHGARGSRLDLAALLLAAHWRTDALELHLADVADAAMAVERHGLTEHGECCGGECPCSLRDQRCGGCKRDPHERLDGQVDALMDVLRDRMSPLAVEQWRKRAAMTDVETLRAASRLMRGRAEPALKISVAMDDWWSERALREAFDPDPEDMATLGAAEDAAHLAAWHPAVALAVADWLDAFAPGFDSGGNLPGEQEAALAVAHAYLGGAS